MKTITKTITITLTITMMMMTGCKHDTPAPAPTYADRTERGISQAHALWRAEDGTEDDFQAFVQEHLATTDSARDALFESLSRLMENLNQSSDLLTVELLKPTQLTNAGEPTDIDWIMSGYNPSAHLSDDLFRNKVAFVTILNFPFYTLEEKNTLGKNWTRRQWAEARLGDIFTSRVPADVQANLAQAYANAENYIADYNICMDRLRTEDGRQLFPDGMLLLSHWNLRDELKADYSEPLTDLDGHLLNEKQEMIYQVMQRIVRQDIPLEVINNAQATWYPYSNRVENAGALPENDRRYQRILDIFHAMQQQDRYCPNMPTAIIRNFEGDIEMPAAEVDSLFRVLLASPQVRTVADEIRARLGRELRPYDIWYDGFKARSSMNENLLTAQTRQLYPTPEAYCRQIPTMLQKLGFQPDKATEIAGHIVVEPARGSGHAWPCLGHNEPARLRTRISPAGMDYKGYNIAVHEMGHNVEEVVSLYLMDYYMLHGIPNTGFTEASAFLFQHRDLQLLGYGRQEQNRDAVLDAFWGMYEIMGVSLVDMQMWQWLYAHPKATAAQLRDATLAIAADVWNAYFEPVLGEKDCILLAIYSHMVNSPMYLPNYPIGHIVQFQLEEAFSGLSDAEWAAEYERCYRLGRLTPDEWMRHAVNGQLSVEPILRKI
ncbi:MAG: hypothetical protein J5635_00770 [Paludibacteraceae bacterium]|nr:hypothetical protein [Paludibacteraceae bacterium]